MTTGAKMRVYELARDVGVESKDLIAKIRALGLEVNNHMSSLDVDDVARVKRSLEKERVASTETKRLSSTVIRRRAKGDEEGATTAAAESAVVRRRVAAPAAEPEAEPVVATPPPVVRRRVATAPVEAEPAPVEREVPAVRAEPPAPAPVEVAAAPAPTPVEAAPPAPAPVIEATAPEPEAAAPAETEKKKPRVFIDLRPKPEPVPEPAPVPAPVAAQAPVAEAAAEEEEDGEAGLSARERFERELARARARVEAREAEETKQKAPEAAAAEPAVAREPGRPAVGSVITLPSTRIKITERQPTTRLTTGGGQIRGRFAQQQGRGGRKNQPRDFGKKKMLPGKKGKSTQITTPAEHKRVIRMEETIAIAELARGMGIKAPEVLKKLWGMGMVGININAAIDIDTASLLANEFGYEVQNVAFKEDDVFVSGSDEEGDLDKRAPVVTVMGHVDHGKTSLLDRIRSARVASGEAGGITQHIAAYRVRANESSGDIVFLDTPGHEAFTEMRARGAQATDIVVLVCAANDGVMPQTIEALNHAKDAGVTIIVAVNKCDLPDAQPERVRQQLADHGLIPEAWGGETIYCDVSALKGEGIDKLLESIVVASEMLELRANANKPASGLVIEAKLDRARGPMATILVQEGTLRAGDIVVAGRYYGKVRALLDDAGQSVKEAGPSTPVELLGLDGVPDAGDTVNVADDDKTAKQVVEHRRQVWRKRELATTAKFSLENIMERINEGEAQELKIVLKADVQGSTEALKAALIKQSTEKVRVNVIQAGVGGITETDVNLAKAGGAIILGFHVRPAGKSAKLAEQEGVDIKLYDIIYEAIDDVRLAMAGLLAPIKREMPVGKLEVRETFSIPKQGTVGGCMVTEGKITRKSLLRVIRDAVHVYEGRVASLRRFKEDASEVAMGYECGVMVGGFNDLKAGDIIETYEIVEEAAKL